MQKSISGMLRNGMAVFLLATLILISINEASAASNVPYQVSGKVVSSEGEELAGVSIVIKGTQTGVATSAKGDFTITIPAGNQGVIIVSFIGMETQEIQTTPAQTKYHVVLKDSEDIKIQEVVVTGYQTIDRRLFTGTASKVSMEDVKLASEPDISKSLEGQIAGVSIQNVSSTFGSAPIVRVRGASSISGNQKPLWVVDGVVLEDAVEISLDQLNSGDLSTLVSSGVAGLNADDIESMQVLKDVSATALYGARAMNGVIVITTKKGRQGKIQVNYSMNVTLKQKPSYSDYNILNSKDQMSVNRELYDKGWINIGNIPSASAHGPYALMFDKIAKNEVWWGYGSQEADAFLRRYEVMNTDWFDVLFKTGVQQQHTVSLSGGGENSSFYASLGYLHDGGWTVADNVDRYTAMLKGSFNVTPKLTVTAQTNLSYRKQRLSGVSDSKNDSAGVDRWTGKIDRNFDNNPFLYALQTSRAMSVYDENGDYEFFRRNFANYNVLDELSKNITQLDVRDMTFQMDMNYRILPKLSFTGRVSARYFSAQTSRLIHETSNEANAYRAGTMPNDSEIIQNANTLLYQRPGSSTGIKYSVLPEGGIYGIIDDMMTNYYLNGNFNWNPVYRDDHMFTFMLGSEVRFVDRQRNWDDGYGHFFDGGNVSKPSVNYIEKLSMDGKSYFGKSSSYDRFAAFFFNYGYSYKGKYTLNGTVRYDGSNRLGKSRTARWLPTWNIGGKWAAKEEDFLKGVSTITQLNVRLTYGLNASLGRASNSSLVAMSQTSSRPITPGASELEIVLKNLANNDLTWEKQYELNAGFDISILRDRLGLVFDYYNRKGFDLIGYYQSSGIGGESLKLGNIADMDSYGFEIGLNTIPVTTKDFRWHFNVNYAYHHSKIKELESTYWFGRAASVYGVPVSGGPIRGIYSARFAGLDNEGVPTFYDRDNNVVRSLNVQSYDYSDFVYSGNLEPSTNLGIQNTFTWKGLSLSALITGQFGHVKRVMQNFNYNYNDSQALSEHIKNRWRVVGDEKYTNIPAIQSYYSMNHGEGVSDIRTAYQLYGMSDYWMADASFIRLKNLGLNYRFPRKLTEKLGISNLNFGFQASNLWLIWTKDADKLGGEDPEFVWSGGTSMPIMKQYTFTLSFGF